MRVLDRLLPLGLLVGAWLLHRSLNLGASVGPGADRVLGWALVVLFAGTLVIEAWRVAGPRLRPVLARRRGCVAFGGFAVLYAMGHAVLTGMVRFGGSLPEGAVVATGAAYGPLTVWPHVEFAWPALGVSGFVTLGRALLLAALAFVFAAAAVLALQAASRRGWGAAGAATAGAFTSAACPGCLAVLPGALALGVGSAAAPWVRTLTDPSTLAAPLLDAVGPVVAFLGLLWLAAPPRPVASRRARVARSVPAFAMALPLVTAPLLSIMVGYWAPARGASPQQRAIYDLYLWTTAGALFLTLLTLAVLVFFSVRYRYREDAAPEEQEVSRGARRAWQTAFVLVPVLVIFSLGFLSFGVLDEISNPPEGTVYVEVSATRFAWHFRYPDGSTSLNELRVQEDEGVVLNVSSADVIHSLYIPDMGVKIDANRGGVNQVAFRPLQPGTYNAYCVEYCGVGHADMNAKLVVFPEGAQGQPYGPSPGAD